MLHRKERAQLTLFSKKVDSLLESSNQSETVKKYNVLKDVIDDVLYVGERGLALSGSSHRIGDPDTGIFIGLI